MPSGAAGGAVLRRAPAPAPVPPLLQPASSGLDQPSHMKMEPSFVTAAVRYLPVLAGGIHHRHALRNRSQQTC